jgi:hypothetical protein
VVEAQAASEMERSRVASVVFIGVLIILFYGDWFLAMRVRGTLYPHP